MTLSHTYLWKSIKYSWVQPLTCQSVTSRQYKICANSEKIIWDRIDLRKMSAEDNNIDNTVTGQFHAAVADNTKDWNVCDSTVKQFFVFWINLFDIEWSIMSDFSTLTDIGNKIQIQYLTTHQNYDKQPAKFWQWFW